jgi:cell division protein FtsL
MKTQRILSLVLLGLFLCFLSDGQEAGGFLSPATSTEGVTVLQQKTDTLQRQEEKLSEKVEAADKEITHLEQGVMIMLGFSALLLALLFGSFILGEYRINQSVKDLQSRAEEVKKRFPMLDGIEEQARSVLSFTNDIFCEDEWVEDRYKSLDIELRQRILTVEYLIALEFAGLATAPQLRGMANLYFSKYSAEKLECDLDRALYYAGLAAKRGSDGFQYKNDLGFIYMDLAVRDPKFWSLAETSLLASKKKKPAQQRCYYNLGILYADKADSILKAGDTGGAIELFTKACKELRTAMQQKDWETKPNLNLTSAAHYNLACFLSRLALLSELPPGHSATLDEAVAHLKSASQIKQTKLSTLDSDLKADSGDLAALARNHLYAQQVQEIHDAFQRLWES